MSGTPRKLEKAVARPFSSIHCQGYANRELALAVTGRRGTAGCGVALQAPRDRTSPSNPQTAATRRATDSIALTLHPNGGNRCTANGSDHRNAVTERAALASRARWTRLARRPAKDAICPLPARARTAELSARLGTW